MDRSSEFNESTATSPPTSMAPQSDDEFTSALVRHAAKRLGFDVNDMTYHPNNNRGAVFGDKPTWNDAPASNRRLGEVLRQIEARQRALGAQHESLVDLHMQAGRQFEQSGELGKAEHHYTSALDVLETCHGSASELLLPTLMALANFYSVRGRFFDAKTMFDKAAHVCDACHSGRQVLLNSESQPQRLKSALLSWKEQRRNEVVARELMVSAAEHASLNSSAEVKPSVADADVQTLPQESFGRSAGAKLTEDSWLRLDQPTCATSEDMRRLIASVKQHQPPRLAAQQSPAFVAASRSAADVKRLLEELRQAKS